MDKLLLMKLILQKLFKKKVKQAYYSGQIIPIDIAQKLLNSDLSKQYFLDKTTLQACVQGVICNTLQSNGIDIQNKVFFGNGHGINLGYYESKHKAIWIDDSLLEKYINGKTLMDKSELFKTMFHEMQHAIQNYNIEIDQIDYLTYNFIKEEIIDYYDPDFYYGNYRSIFMESDARKSEILGTLDFLNGLNPDFIEFIEKNKDNNYISYINETIPLREQQLTENTKTLLALIYRDYFCSPSMRKDLLLKEQEEIENEEMAKYKIEFKNNKRDQNTVNERTSLVECKEENIIKKIYNKIKKLFNYN